MTAALDTSAAAPPHGGQPVLAAGAALEQAAVVAICLHGRGGSAGDILGIVPALGMQGLCGVAPQAHGSSWYPLPFMAPREANQPGLDSAHDLVERLLELVNDRGFPAHRVALIGFSQGACLATDHAARFPRRYGLVAAFTGGLIGPPGSDFRLDGSLAGTPVFLGSSDPDPHVPWARVAQTAEVLEGLGAAVTLRRYPGAPHAVNDDEIAVTRTLLERLVRP